MIEQRISSSPDRAIGGRVRRGLTFDQLLVFAVVVVPALVVLRSSMATVDLAYQVRAGQIMLDTGHILRVDPFTFTAFGHAWLDQQWGAQIALALLYRAGGWPTIALADAVMASSAISLVYLACRARGAGVRPAAWLALGGLLVAVYGFSPRPQMFAFLLFALTLALVSVRGSRPRILWLAPVVTVIWANVHGSFVLSPLLLGIAWLEDRRSRSGSERTTLFVALASALATLINPYGLRVWSYVVDLSTNPEVRHTIEEWQPPRPTTYTGSVFFLSVVAVALFASRHRRQLDWPRLLGLAVFAVIGITAVRGIIWWALAAPVLISDVLPARRVHRDRSRVLNGALAVALVVIGIVYLPWLRPTFTSTANSGTVTDGLLAYAPARYTAILGRQVPAGARVFAPEIWASWFEFAVPEDRVMVDPRIEVFPASVWDDYDEISAAEPGWQRTLDRWRIDVLALSTVQQPRLISEIGDDPVWVQIHRDRDGVLLVRSPSSG